MKTRSDGLEVYCKDCKRDLNARTQRRLREDVLNAYGGPICINCGEDFFEVLVLDHIGDDGNVDKFSTRGLVS